MAKESPEETVTEPMADPVEHCAEAKTILNVSRVGSSRSPVTEAALGKPSATNTCGETPEVTTAVRLSVEERKKTESKGEY